MNVKSRLSLRHVDPERTGLSLTRSCPGAEREAAEEEAEEEGKTGVSELQRNAAQSSLLLPRLQAVHVVTVRTAGQRRTLRLLRAEPEVLTSLQRGSNCTLWQTHKVIIRKY